MAETSIRPRFPYHFQDDPEYCGPACLMMLLESRGLPVSAPPLYPSDLWRELGAVPDVSCRAFASSPGAMAAVATARLEGTGLAYEVYPPQTPEVQVFDDDAMLRAISSRLSIGPVLVMTRSGGHWVVVFGEEQGGYFVCSPDWHQGHRVQEQPHHEGICPACTGGTGTLYTRESLLQTFTPVFTRTPTTYTGRRLIVAPRLVPPPPAVT